MKKMFNLEFITPAFLSGADQNKAELRVPSIKGELRWWFRVLGGDLLEERQVFGGMGKDEPIAGKVIVRVRELQAYYEELPKIVQMSDFGYLYYFASVSGNGDGIKRTAKEAFFYPGTRFIMDIFDRPENPVPSTSQKRLDLAIQCFVRLGALGLRSTRGCGAMTESDNLLSREEFVQWTDTLCHQEITIKTVDVLSQTWKECQERLGAYLRNFRRDNNFSGKNPSALGFSKGRQRESSALHLRPVKVKEGYLPVIVYTDAACSQPSIKDKL